VRKKKVLILDDSPLVRELVDITLSEYGYDVVGLSSPFEFTAALRREHPDLVLMDVTMPALAGDKVVEFTRQYSSDRCPIVLFSDRSDAELAMLASKCGADGYIRKTSASDVLPDLIAQFIRG
jgi:DNA-binding NarL/FixJ family response regulator